MILTGPKIQEAVEAGDIVISPFDAAALNPNSYNYRLGRRLLVTSTSAALDSAKVSPWTEVEIPVEGLVLLPRRLYLGHTVERIGSARYVTTLMGRSSVGRLGVFLQAAADLGNLAVHRWTLELSVVQPVRLYAEMVIGQVCFWEVLGDTRAYTGVYAEPPFASPAVYTDRLLSAQRRTG